MYGHLVLKTKLRNGALLDGMLSLQLMHVSWSDEHMECFHFSLNESQRKKSNEIRRNNDFQIWRDYIVGVGQVSIGMH